MRVSLEGTCHCFVLLKVRFAAEACLVKLMLSKMSICVSGIVSRRTKAWKKIRRVCIRVAAAPRQSTFGLCEQDVEPQLARISAPVHASRTARPLQSEASSFIATGDSQMSDCCQLEDIQSQVAYLQVIGLQYFAGHQHQRGNRRWHSQLHCRMENRCLGAETFGTLTAGSACSSAITQLAQTCSCT